MTTPEPETYAASVVRVLREHGVSWLPTAMDAEIVTKLIEEQQRDPKDSFEVIVDSPHAARWRLKARSDDRTRVRLACFALGRNSTVVEFERTVNDALRALET
jgi:hypothetical protein